MKAIIAEELGDYKHLNGTICPIKIDGTIVQFQTPDGVWVDTTLKKLNPFYTGVRVSAANFGNGAVSDILYDRPDCIQVCFDGSAHAKEAFTEWFYPSGEYYPGCGVILRLT